LKHKILHGIDYKTISHCLPRYQFSGTSGNNFKLAKHYR